LAQSFSEAILQISQNMININISKNERIGSVIAGAALLGIGAAFLKKMANTVRL